MKLNLLIYKRFMKKNKCINTNDTHVFISSFSIKCDECLHCIHKLYIMN